MGSTSKRCAKSLGIAMGIALGCDSPTAAPPATVIGPFADEQRAGRVVEFDLRDPDEARQWQLRSGIASASATAAGLAIATEGADPYFSRPLDTAGEIVEAVEIETAEPFDASYRVFLAVAGVEAEARALDSAAQSADRRTQVADFRVLPTPPFAVDGIRIDPPPGEARFLLTRVRARLRGRDGRLNILGDARECRMASSVSAPARGFGQGALLVSVGLPTAAPDPEHGSVGTIEVTLRASDGAIAHRSRHRVSLEEAGWKRAIADIAVDPPISDGALEVSFADSRGEPLAACFEVPTPLPETVAGGPPNVLLVSLDTLRADHLDDAPFLTALGSRGRSFARVWSSANYTLPSHASLFTGVPAHLHETPPTGGMPPFAGVAIPRELATLAETLRANGFATAATTEGGLIAAPYGFARGFDRYHTPAPDAFTLREHERFAASFAASTWGRPFFLFVHTYEIHDYFLNTAKYQEFVDPTRDEAAVGAGNLIGAIHAGKAPADYVKRLYVAGVRRADEFLERVVTTVRLASRNAPLLVIATSDHGESFGDHPGIWHHGSSLLEEQVSVPLVAWGNFAGAPRGRVEAQVASIDVAPSLLRRLDVPVPATFVGRNDLLLDAIPAGPSAPLIASQSQRRTFEFALTDGSWRYLRSDGFDGRNALEHCFLVDSDPDERNDRLPENPPACLALRDEFEKRIVTEMTHSWLIRSNARLEIDLGRDAGLVAVQCVHASPVRIAELATGRIDWTPALPDDALAVYLREPLHSIEHLALDGIEMREPIAIAPGGEPAVVSLPRPDGSTARVEIAASRHVLGNVDGDGHVDPALRERLRALGYLH